MNYLCRHCNANLDGGDIFEQLRKEPEYAHYTFNELIIASLDYGWTMYNRKHFTREFVVKGLTICPECDGIDPLFR